MVNIKLASIQSPKSFQTKDKSTKNVQEKEELVGLRRLVEKTQKQRVSSIANESVVVTSFREELQKIGTFITSTGYQLLTLGKKQFKKPKESDAEAAKARGERVKERRKRKLERQEIEAAKKRKKLNQSGLPIQEIDFTSDIASTASSSSLDTNLNEPSCGTSCDGCEETNEIFQADKSASTDVIEIRPE